MEKPTLQGARAVPAAYGNNIDPEIFLVDVAGKALKHISIMSTKHFENLDKMINGNNWRGMKSWT